MPSFEVTKRGRIPSITWPEPIGPSGSKRVLVQFCEHFDSARADVEMIESHMAQAKEEGAPIVKMGDTFDACGGRYDPRRSPEGVRREFVGPDYLDRLVNIYGEFAAPYAENIAVMGRGNHELSVMKHCDTDLISRTAEQLRQNGSKVITVGNQTFANFTLWITKTTRVAIIVYFTHESGTIGAAKGVVGAVRRGAVFPDAAVVVSGGGHSEWQTTVSRDRLNEKTGRVYTDEQIHFGIASYRRDWSPEGPRPSWHCQDGKLPRPIGAAWLELSIQKSWDERLKHDDLKRGRRLPMWRIAANVTRAK